MMNIYIYLFVYFIASALTKPLFSDDEEADENEVQDYKGFQVITAVPNTEEQLLAVNLIKTNMTEECDLDWWSGPSTQGLPVSVMVPPPCVDNITNSLDRSGMEYNVTLEDLQDTILRERQYRSIVLSRKIGFSDNWVRNVYHNLAEIRERVDWLVAAHPDIITKHSLGTTHEGRSIDVLHLSQRQEGSSVRKPGIWLDCGIHSREWVSPPACLHAIETLAMDVNSVDPRDNLLSEYDFYILPVANPDGYVYSWTSDRMWRKNRRPTGTSQSAPQPGWGGGFGQGWGQQQHLTGQGSSRCSHGVDPNRNFPAIWEQASDNKCDQSYKGSAPFSEPESQAIRKGVQMMKRNSGQIAAFISIHAYSQFWMSPYGYSYTKPQDYGDHMRVMKIAVDALEKRSGTSYKYGPISEIIYQAFGSSIDWTYDQGIKYSFALELRDTGYKGFLLPQDQIEATVEETWAGLKAMAWAIGPEFGIHHV